MRTPGGKLLDRFDYFIILANIILFAIAANLPFKVNPFGDFYFHNEAKIMAAYIKGDCEWNSVKITHAPGPVFFYTVPYLFVKSDPVASRGDIVPSASDTINADSAKNAGKLNSAASGSNQNEGQNIGNHRIPRLQTIKKDKNFWWAGVLWSLCWMIVCTLLIRRIGTLLLSGTAGKIAVITLFIFPIHIYYTLGITAEAVGFFSAVFFIYGWARWRDSNYSNFISNTGWWIMVLGLAALILNRPNTILIIGIIILVIIGLYFTNKPVFSLTARGLFAASILVFFIGFGVLQLVKLLPNRFNGRDQTGTFYYVEHEGRFEFRNEPWDWRYWDNETRNNSTDYADWLRSTDSLKQVIVSKNKTYKEVYKDFVLNDFSTNIFRNARQAFVKIIYGQVFIINSIKPDKFTLGPLHGETAYVLIHLLINIVNILLFVFSILFLFSIRGRFWEYWPLWCIWFSLIIFHSLSYVEPRYFFPARVDIVLMSALYISEKFFKHSANISNNKIKEKAI